LFGKTKGEYMDYEHLREYRDVTVADQIVGKWAAARQAEVSPDEMRVEASQAVAPVAMTTTVESRP
jgi:hypothetical protein